LNGINFFIPDERHNIGLGLLGIKSTFAIQSKKALLEKEKSGSK
jgi:hypothetical protein